MKREWGWGVAGVLALAATAGVSLQRGGSSHDGENAAAEHRTNPRQEHRQKTLAPQPPETPYERACDDIAESLELFLAAPVDTLPRPNSCYDPHASAIPKGTVPGKEPQGVFLKFVIATLPDPTHTHLPLLFDRMAEVVQEAAQDEDYSYEASWLPWDDKEDTYQYLNDDDEASDRKEKREQQPGILLFRRNPASTQQTDATKNPLPSSQLQPYQDGLIVFVVGEDPTRGIHLEQFEHALEWIDELRFLDGDNRSRAAILGPSFSGSFPSLEKVLTAGASGAHVAAIRERAKAKLPIYSGTANSRHAIEAFESFEKSRSGSGLNIEFRKFLEYDEVGLERYCQYVNKANGHDSTRDHFEGSKAIAVISEDETAFGTTPSDNDRSSAGVGASCLSRALWLYYPRDISALRAAYQSNSIFDSNAPQQLSDVGRGSLPSNIADPEGQEHDTIRSYAGNQTPLSQEAYLLGLVNAMREHHTDYVILRSTNALDQIFLARYLRRAYPDARIVIDGADRLFERERGSTGMGGAMSLSTYPLLERERDWINPSESAPNRRSFNSDFSEGTYIALRLLLHSEILTEGAQGNPNDTYELPDRTGTLGSKAVCKKKDASAAAIVGSLRRLNNKSHPCTPPLSIPDYGLPPWLNRPCCDLNKGEQCDAFETPATWLSVIGRDGFWGVAALDEKTLDACSSGCAITKNEERAEIPLSLKIGLIALLVFSGFHAWCCGWASFTAKPAFLTHFANPGEERHTVLIFLGSTFAAILPLFVGWGCGVFDPSVSVLSQPWSILGPVIVVCALALASTFLNIFRIEKLRIKAGGTAMTLLEKGTLIVWVCEASTLSVFIFFAAFAFPLQSRFIPANRFFTYYRSMHLMSGVSPVVPFLALSLGMYLWFWYSLHGLALFGSDRCRLPEESDFIIPDPHSEAPLHVLRMFSQRTADGTEESANPLEWRTLRLSLILCGTFIAAILIVSRGVPVRSLGTQYYAKLILLCLVFCISLMLASAWQLSRTWSKLRELLMFLDRTTLRRTLAALRGFSWGSVWTMSGNVLDVRYKLLSRQLESLHHTRTALDDFVVQRSADAARCCIAARSCIAVPNQIKAADQDAPVDEALTELKKMRKSATGGLLKKLDAAVNCILAQRHSKNTSADPLATAAIQDCISALEKFFACDAEYEGNVERDCIRELDATEKAAMGFALWYADNYNVRDAEDLERLEHFQQSAAKTAGILLAKLLLPEWRKQTDSLILEVDQRPYDTADVLDKALLLSDKQHIRDAEEFVCLPYLGFVQNILGRMRTIVMGILCLYLATAAAISSYPFDPRQGLSGSMLALFAVLATIIFYVYAQMHRDATLSHVTNTKPGELGSDFWFKVLGFGLAPLLGLLTTVFPSISDFVFSWLQPGLQSIK